MSTETKDRYESHKLDGTDKTVEIISVLLLVVTIFLVANAVSNLPEIVPSHFKLTGEADSYGSKHFLWIPVVISVFMYVLLSVISHYPKLYKTRMTKHNNEEQSRLTSKMARTMKATFLFIFLVCTYVMTKTAELKMTEFIIYLIPLVLIPIFTHIIYWVWRYSKMV